MDFSNLVVLFRVLWRKVWLIISIPIIAMLVTFALTWDMPDRYKSTAQLSTGYTTNEQILITNDPNSLRDINVKFNNLIETMKSEIILTLVSYRLVLHDLQDERPFRKLSKEKLAPFTQEDIDLVIKISKEKLENMELLSSFDLNERKVINFIGACEYSSWQLVEDLQVVRIKDTDYIRIQYISEDPRLSAFVVNTLAEEIIRYDNKIKQSRSGQSVTFFENLMNEKKKILDEKTALLNSYKTSNNVVNYSLETTSRIGQISDYELKKNEAVNRIQAIRLSIANVDRRLSELGNDPTTTVSNDKLLQLRSKIDELNKIYLDGGSKDENLRKTLSDLRFEYQVEMDRLASLEQVAGGQTHSAQKLELLDKKNQLELELEIANANLASINTTLATLNNSVSGIASKEVTISLLTSEVENASKEYKEALDRFNTERNKSLVAASPLRLVVVGQPNGYPERSKRVVFIAFAGLASLIICVAAIVTLELIDLRLKNPGQFRRLASLELAGTLNQINSKRLNLDYLFNTQTKDRELSAFKHSLRNLRFMLESTNAQTFLVTSTKIGEGKSFIILCLAYSLSLVKKKILIIDTNFKHNSLTQELLAISSDHKKLESGFYIRGLIGKGNPDEIPEDDFVTSIISPTSHQGINVIGNSGGDKSPSEIFAGRDFKKMLNKLKERYDYIFLEGAALNHFSDTKELVEYVDKVIPVFNAESTLRQIDQESLGYLKSLNGKLVGSILNGIALGELKI